MMLRAAGWVEMGHWDMSWPPGKGTRRSSLCFFVCSQWRVMEGGQERYVWKLFRLEHVLGMVIYGRAGR